MTAAALLSAAFCLATGGASADTVRLSTTVAETSNWVKGAQRFKELVEERSDGRHTVEIYPSGVLVGGNDRVELEMAQAGAVDMIMKSTPWLSQLDDDFMVIGMPWIFPDADAAMAIRTPGLELYIDSWKAIGAVPVAMSFAEVFTALQAGAIDGGISPIPLIYASRFFEVSKNIALINFSFEAIGLLAGDVFWQRLSPEDQELIRTAAVEAMAYQRELAASEEAELIAKMEETGVTVQTPSDENLAEFKDAVAPVYATYRDKLGAELVDLVEQEVASHGTN